MHRHSSAPARTAGPPFSQLSRDYSIVKELRLGTRFDPVVELAGQEQVDYSCRRALIESMADGEDYFVIEGTIAKRIIQVGPAAKQIAFEDQRKFQEWKHGD